MVYDPSGLQPVAKADAAKNLLMAAIYPYFDLHQRL
jgi:hypothetical protein